MDMVCQEPGRYLIIMAGMKIQYLVLAGSQLLLDRDGANDANLALLFFSLRRYNAARERSHLTVPTLAEYFRRKFLKSIPLRLLARRARLHQ